MVISSAAGRVQMSVLALVSMLTPSLHAQVSGPPGCTARRDHSGYVAGLAQGRALVRQSFALINDCDEIERFSDMVIANVSRLTLPKRASAYLACRYGGTVDGVYEAIDEIFASCGDTCFAEGVAFGEIAGNAYCTLSIALGGLSTADAFTRGPVLLCGAQFETGCDSSFMGTTFDFGRGACLPFTVAPFDDVWDQFRNNQCIYEPPLVEGEGEGEL
jgi:hypothetical protein